MAAHAADYPFRVNKVTISGTCFAGQEEWSTGFYMGDTGADAGDPGTTAAAAVAEHWATYFTGSNSKTSTAFNTTSVKVSQLQLDGDVDLTMIDIYDFPAAIVGTNGGAPLPPQITLAATLTSDNQRGLASKGRMYLPGVNLGINQTDPHISPTEQGHIGNGLKTFFDSVNADGDIPGYAVLASKGSKLINVEDPNQWVYINGVIARLTGLRVGNVYDTQRRRRNDLVEAYTSRVLA